jgi:hypothetical protein
MDDFEVRREWMIGAGDGIRTRDIDLGKVALYQLSYSRPTGKPYFPSETIPVSNVMDKILNP